MVCKFSVYIYTEHSITTVLLQYAVLYNNGLNIVIFLFLMFLFLKILYNKILYILYQLFIEVMYSQYIRNLYKPLRADTEGVQSTVWKGRDLFLEDDPKND